MQSSESPENLSWLEPGQTYRCDEALVVGEDLSQSPRLKNAHHYRFEGFSSDPLGDTRQYLFSDVSDGRAYAVELSHEHRTPEWRRYLSPA